MHPLITVDRLNTHLTGLTVGGLKTRQQISGKPEAEKQATLQFRSTGGVDKR